MSGLAALMGLLGLGVGLGLLTILRVLRRPLAVSSPPHRWGDVWRRLRGNRGWWWIAAAGASGLVIGLVTGWVVGAVLAALATWTLPRMLGSNVQHRRHIARIEAIAGWTEMLRDTLAAAAGLEQAMTVTAPIAPVAIRSHVLELATRLNRGERLNLSLRLLADEFADPTADLVINALIAASDHHARQLSSLLGRLAQIARARVEMRHRVETSRARTRTTLRVIVATFAVFVGGLILLNKKFLAPYNGVIGQLVLLLIGAIFTLAFAWLRRMTRIDEPERFLGNTEGGANSAGLPDQQEAPEVLSW